MDSGSGSNIGGRDPAWKYYTPIEGNRNGIICNFCGMVIKSGGITQFKFHLSYTDPHSNSKKCSNVLPEMQKEMRQLLVEMNKAKAKKATNIEKIRDELRDTMGGCKTRENSNFLKKFKIVISVKIQNFYRSWMTKRTSPLESSREI